MRLSQRSAFAAGAALVALSLGPAAAAASDKLVYIANGDPPEGYGIWMADADGLNPTRVTDSVMHEEPAFSPDGRTVAFTMREDTDFTQDLYLVDIDGQNERLLFNDTAGWSREPVFSPDTEQVLFERSDPSWGTPDIYRIDLDGQNLTQLTADLGSEHDPSFSSDGNLVIFSDDNSADYLPHLATMKPDGSERTFVTTDPRYWDEEPVFSPDGEEIAFARYDTTGFEGHEIWKANADGTNAVKLTTTPRPNGWSGHATWSADGRTIVYTRNSPSTGEPSQIWAMNADGANQHKLFEYRIQPRFQQPDAMEVSGDMFDDIYLDFDLDPAGNYEVTVSARDSVNGIARYELLVDSGDGEGYVVKDSVDLDCSNGCPQQGPEKTLALNSAYVPNDKSDMKVRAIDGVSNAASRSREVAKRKQFGISDFRLDDAEDPMPFPLHTDPRLAALKPKYFRLFVPWERLEPARNQLDWNADIGGGPLTDKMTIDDQINQIKAISPDVEIVVTFWQTPCWAVIPRALQDTMPPGENECTRENGGFPNNNPWSWPDPYPDGRSYRGTSEYKQLVRQFAARYSDPESPNYQGIKYYTVWNEPNVFGQAQPQRCKQGKGGDSDFQTIRCPGGERRGAMTADDYHMLLYDRLYQAINVDPTYGRPRKRLPSSAEVLAGDTADIWQDVDGPGVKSSSDEAEFTHDVVKHILDEDSPPCGAAPWAKHGHNDISVNTYDRLRRVHRVLDGTDPDTGEPDPGLHTSGCTAGKQIWVTEMAANYDGHADTPDADPTQPCRLHDFFSGEATSSDADRRRVDVFVQYLYQTEWDHEARRGFDSGLLRRFDVNDDTPRGGADGRLDKRQTYHVFKDWSLYARNQRPQPSRKDYRDSDRADAEYVNCTGFWGS